MTPVIPCSVSNFAFVPRNAFTVKKNRCIGRFSCTGKSTKQSSLSQKFLLHFPANLRLLPRCQTSRVDRLSETGIDVEVETKGSPSGPEDSVGSPSPGEPSTSSPAPSKRSRPPRRSDMPPINNEDLVPGATFTGKVRSIQPFGPFVDFGAFTDGLVHVSRLSNTFVKDVASVLSVGQEVKVRVVEVNPEIRRIALSMRENDDNANTNTSQRNDPSASNDKGRPPRRKVEVKKASKFVKGQEIVGTVKNLVRSGVFIALPEGKEGFLPASEEADDGIPNLTGSSSLEVGQEVTVRVLRISRGQLTLTTKKEEDFQKLDSELNKGMIHMATNPFVLAFRQNKDISAFLDEREKSEEVAQTSESNLDVEEATAAAAAAESVGGNGSVVDEVVGSDGKLEAEHEAEASVVEDVSTSVEEVSASQTEDAKINDKLEVPSLEENPSNEVVETESEASTAEIAGDTAEDKTEDSVNKDQASVDDSGDAADQAPDVESSIEEVQPPTSETEISDAASEDGDGTVLESAVGTEQAAEEQTVTIENDLASPSAKDQSVSSSDEKAEAAPPIETSAKSIISPAMVKQLRDETGAGMDCKKALSEIGGDITKALEYLRKKGLASAEKKASRVTAEGRIGSYLHDSRIGVLIEVNCETDFVSRGDIFRELVDDLAMQVAACPQVVCLVPEDIPKETADKEREIELQKEDLLSEPEQIQSRIVDGRIKKRLDELALLEQPYIKNDKVLLKDWVKQTIATIGENIKVRRFVRYNLGEGLEKKSQDFAAEVAAQTAARPPPTPAKEQPALAESADKPAVSAPAVAISAALAKQIREETGAGMMDCKKALSETGGDLEKAQEYL